MLLASSNIAEAHDEETLDEWVDEWIDRVLDEGVTIEAFNEWTALARRHPRFFNRPVPHEHRAGRQTPVVGAPTTRGWPVGVERWRSVVESYFPASQVATAMCVINGESRGNPNAKNNKGSSAAGLWQFLRDTWNRAAAAHGGPTYNEGGPYDPVLATQYAAWLQARGSGWRQWTASRGC